MYIDKDGQQIWQDESTTYDIRNTEGEVIRTLPATLKESGLWITDNGVALLVEPSEAWKAENQPVVIPEPTFEPIDETTNALIDAVLMLSDRLAILEGGM